MFYTMPEGFYVDAPIESGVALLPANTLVGLDAADGIWKRATATGVYNLLGILTKEYDTSDDSADGDTTAKVAIGRIIKLVGSGLAATDVGKSAFVADNQTISTTQGEGALFQVEVTGGAAGALTATGVLADDEIVQVLGFDYDDSGASQDFADFTDETTVTDDDEITTSTTDTTGYTLLVTVRRRAAAYIGPIVEVPSATEAFVLVEGRSPSRV